MKILAKFDIKKIQYMNIFEKVVGIKAKSCFIYNSIIIFIVPKNLVTKAIGKKAANMAKLNLKLNRKVKIVASPTSQADLGNFINVIIFPHKYRKLSLTNNELIIFSASREKAAIIGRGKTRLKELADVLNRFFDIKKVIIK